MPDDRTAFETRLADVFDRYADLASVEVDPWVVAQAAAGASTRGWRSRIGWLPAPPNGTLSWLLLLLAALLVAVVGQAVVGSLRHGDDLSVVPPVPPTIAPSPAAVAEPLDGFTVEDIEPGVTRIVNDGVRDLVWPRPSRDADRPAVVATGEGAVWMIAPQLFELGASEIHDPENVRTTLDQADPFDFTLYNIRSAIRWSFALDYIRAQADGSVAARIHRVDLPDAYLSTHGPDGWSFEPVPGASSSVDDLAVGPGGTVWVWLDARGTNPPVLARFDESGWRAFDYSDGVRPFKALVPFPADNGLQVAPDGAVWVPVIHAVGDSCDGIARYDGEQWVQYLTGTGTCILQFDIAPDGSIWALAWPQIRRPGATSEFVWDEGPVQLFVIRHDEAIAADPAAAAELPDPDLVAVTDGQDGGLSLYDIGTGEVRSLAPDASDMKFAGSLSGAIDGRPAWSPNREEIAYFAKGGSLRVVRVADGTSREVARTEPLSEPWGYLELLAWSPDGSWIATPTIPEWTPGTRPTFTDARSGLLLVNVQDPSRSMVLSSDDAAAPVFGGPSDDEPALDWSAGYWSLVGWSPSGRSLALVYQNGPARAGWTPPYVVLIDATGSGSRAIRVPEQMSYAAWIDEEHLLVKPHELEDSSGRPLFVLDLTSGHLTQLVPDPVADPQANDLLPSYPAVSPDGSLIAFHAFGLVVIDPAGEVLQQIDVGPCSRRPTLDFSVSGRQVLLRCGHEGWQVADLDTSTVRDVDLPLGFASW